MSWKMNAPILVHDLILFYCRNINSWVQYLIFALSVNLDDDGAWPMLLFNVVVDFSLRKII